MMVYVIDENVPIVANDASRNPHRSPQADARCRANCISELKSVVRCGVVIVDEAGEVISNYRRHLRADGQPGIGDAFLKHVSDTQFDIRRVLRVSVPRNNEKGFEHFPDTDELRNFDRSDRIFIALALASPKKCVILNAVDSDYHKHEKALTKAGVDVRELCPQCIKK